MKKQSHFVFIASAISILVPANGRFAIGLIACISILFITFFGTIFSQIIKKVVAKDSVILYQFFFIVLLATFLNELLKIYSPVLAVYSGFTIYLTAFSSMLFGFFLSNDIFDFQATLTQNMRNAFFFSLFVLFFFLLRDYLGYSTITLPVSSGFWEITLPSINLLPKSFFLGSIPCAIFILACTLSLITFISRKFDIVRRKIY